MASARPWLTAGTALLVGGCSIPETPWLAPPAVDIRVDQASRGPATRTDARRSHAVAFRVHALARLPDCELGALAALVAGFERHGDERPVRAVGAGTVGARAGEGAVARHFLARLDAGEFGPHAVLGSAQAVVAEGLDVEFTKAVPDDPGSALVAQSWTVVTRLDGDEVRVELRLRRWLRDLDDEPEGVRKDAAERRLRADDVLVLRAQPALDAAPLLVLVPWTDMTGRDFVLGFEITVRAEEAATEADLEAARRDALRTMSERAAASRPASSGDLGARIVATAWQRLAERPHQRATLGVLAPACSAPLAADVALLAEDTLVHRICERAHEFARSERTAPSDLAMLGWLLERACLEELGEAKESGTLSPALQGQLWIHLGESARSLDSVLRASRRLRSCREFAEWLADEQLAALSDRSASVRLRAHGWLLRHERPVPAYEPLADLGARRSALRQYEEATTASRPTR